MPDLSEFERRVERLVADPPVAPTPVAMLQARASGLRWRRRVIAGAVVLVMVGGVLAAGVAVWPRGSKSTVVQVTPPGAVRTTVAYVAPDGVHIPNGVRVVGGTGATRPRWSANGAWLAYQDRAQGLWVVRADGSGARRVADKAQRWDWAPVGGRLGVERADSEQLTVVDVERSGSWTAPGRVDDFMWSPDGASIVYSALLAPRSGGWVDDVFVARLDTPERFCVVLCPDIRKVAIRVGGHDVDTGADVGVFFASWSPDGTTLLIWLDGNHSSSIAMDGLPLHELAVSGGITRPVTRTLIRRDWIAWSPDGSTFATVESSGRMRGDTPRRVVTCLPATASCHTVAENAVDPAWSPDGTHISFVHAVEQPPTNAKDWPTQYARRSLVVADTDGTSPHDIPNTSGAGSPQWLDNDNIVFVHDGGLTVVDEASGQEAELVHAVGLPGDIPPPNPYEATDLVGYAWTNSFDLQKPAASAPLRSTSTSERTTTTTASTLPTAPMCSLDQLRATFGFGPGSGPNGTLGSVLVTNAGNRACALQGRPDDV